jgi:polyhydroxybutyrate depolymerase
MLARSGISLPTNLHERSVDVNGVRRTFLTAPANAPGGPLLIVLHGAGGAGLGMAALTGLAVRGPASGFTVVFPDGVGGVWNDNRDAPGLRRREGVDDVEFLRRLVDDQAIAGIVDRNRVFLTGISNGALLAEHVARHNLLPVHGIGLVAGSATVRSREAMPRPRVPTALVAFAGTADPLIPYGGGPIGPLGRVVGRRSQRQSEPARGVAVGIETVAVDWAAVNGLLAMPAVEQVAVPPDDLPVTRLTWQAPSALSVVVHKIDGGGHTWPGAAQYLPARFVCPVARTLDASAIMLAAFATLGAR